MKNFLRKTMKLMPILAIGLVICVAGPARAAVWQYAVEAERADGKPATAYLWVPHESEQIRGVLIGGLTLIEPTLAQDPVIRQACREADLAIVYFAPSIDAVMNEPAKTGPIIQKALDELAAKSNYPELAIAPWLPFGHSVSTLFASSFAAWQPERAFGAIMFKGGIRELEGQSLKGIPILAIKGQYEEFGGGPSGVLRDFEDRTAAYKGMINAIESRRGKDPAYLLDMLVEPGGTHYAYKPESAKYMAMFIKKAAAARIPAFDRNQKTPVQCKTIDPASGWVSELDLPKGPKRELAPADSDKLAAGETFWHLDEELARAHHAFHKDFDQKKPQFLSFAYGPGKGPRDVMHDMRLKIRKLVWSGPDTFKVYGGFFDKVPKKYPAVEGDVTHASGPVKFRVFSGPVEQVGDDEFRVLSDGGRTGGRGAYILAYHPGDASHRYAAQPARFVLPREKRRKGGEQEIKFDAPGTVSRDQMPLKLTATASSGLPVSYYVRSGPAVVADGELRLAQVPQRAEWPLKIELVAYQFGSMKGELVKPAAEISHTIAVTKQ